MLEKLPEVVGLALRDRRAGLEKLVFNRCGMRAGHGTLQVSSLAFADHAAIPLRYTADGEGISPPVQWTGVPQGVEQVVLVVEDADAPTSDPLVHAILVDLPPEDGSLAEGAMTSAGPDGTDVHEGRNSYLRAAWLPPDPPPGHGEHRYVFQVFALSPGGQPFGAKPGRNDVLEAIRERGIASGMRDGTYARPAGTVKDDEAAPVAVANVTPAGPA
jgi:Raf kinase inhibitor-like YbhB/YbcL family protein